MDRDELKAVFNDTVDMVESGKIPKDLVSELIDVKRYKAPLFRTTTDIQVLNIDCIEAARMYAKNGKVCILNMASNRTPGGGVRKGAMAQEEELCRRSNLIFGLDDNHYVIPDDKGIYTKDVTFFKNQYYQYMDQFRCDVITVAAINLGMRKIDPNYKNVTTDKISTILYEPYIRGCKNLILSAFGCGAFKNDPAYISGVFKSLLDSGFNSLYRNIIFAILNDRNSMGNNYQIFKSKIEDIY